MKNFDYLTKTLINSFSYTTTTKDRESFSNVIIDGRTYTKWGTLQAVTIVGNLYEDFKGNRILVCGVAKQHPCDTKCDKQMAYEVAQEHAMNNPDFVFYTVPKYMNKFTFAQMVSWYVESMKLDFIKTRQEIKNNGDNPEKYNR